MTANAAPGRRHRLLLGVVVLVWAVSWPVIKLGVAAVPPIWFACLRYVIATACLFAVVAARGELALPSASDLFSLMVITMRLILVPAGAPG